jgi:hypothetical protein
MDGWLIVGLIITLLLVAAFFYLGREPDPKEFQPDINGYVKVGSFTLKLATNPGDIRCRFSYVCSKKWEDLEITESDDVKFCTKCEEPVFRAKTIDIFDQYAEEKKCTYWEGSREGVDDYLDIPTTGRLVTPRSESETSFLGKLQRFLRRSSFS